MDRPQCAKNTAFMEFLYRARKAEQELIRVECKIVGKAVPELEEKLLQWFQM
jgi:hypothetical protein